MKLSVSWIFDHIDADWNDQNIEHIVATFNRVTAEIERYERYELDLDPLALVRISSQNDHGVTVEIPEWKQTATLSFRDDISTFPDAYYLVHRDGDTIRWATCSDVELDKDGLLPAFSCEESWIKGAWKKHINAHDYILDVDNKSITHRPDMWGHRGFAREIAAFLDLPFIEKESLLAMHEVSEHATDAQQTQTNLISIVNKATQSCPRFAGLYFPSVTHAPANLAMAFRLMSVGSRSINALVDLTNYVMLDWSQPLHAFDADKISGEQVVIRHAKKKETLTLLDDTKLELSPDDLVIANAEKPMALAGVMGGSECSVLPTTTSLFLEAAHFNAVTIRRTAQRHKTRTEASARFEKTLDPNQIVDAIKRFLYVARDYGMNFIPAQEIFVLGAPIPEETIEISHDFIVTRLGFDISSSDVVAPLQRLGFEVENKGDTYYYITVPTFRGTKDVKIKEDIVEEVGREYGFDRIPLHLPAFARTPNPARELYRKRKIKQFLTYGARMVEQQNYAFFDERVLDALEWDPTKGVVRLDNPISEHYVRLATTLIPLLAHNVMTNATEQDDLAFFELGRAWHVHKKDIVEQQLLSGIFFHKKEQVDFYACKQVIVDLLALLGFDARWEKVSSVIHSWEHAYQTATIWVHDQCIGSAGMMDPAFVAKLDVLPESSAFIFELDADFLLTERVQDVTSVTMPRYPHVTFDLSCFVPLTCTAAKLENALRAVSTRVEDVQLVDFFEKEEWHDKRSLAFRITLRDAHQTLAKDDIDQIREKAISVLESYDAQLRG